ncbi:MAG TPA: 5'/3'-nucleotidase SurE [Candidatus Binatia bacterium]|jgi:5'-nucleotidase|nr:5'/3'-nucleotidase SurE [Candidatus Binatia bacterium]
MDPTPLILVCNDDGIVSEGLQALADAVSAHGRVVVVAPDREQSAVSHALTLHRPLRIDQVAPDRYTVDGTPTDCVNLAINAILKTRPTLIVSGINKGANLGDDVTYSGTVSAAMEGTLLGVPSIAFSQIGRGPYDFSIAADFASRLVGRLLAAPMPPDTLLNVNVPRFADGARPTGVSLTRMGKRRYGDAIVEKVDPRGRKYYWIGGEELAFVEEEGTDFSACRDGRISVTPIHLDLTNYASFAALQRLEEAW